MPHFHIWVLSSPAKGICHVCQLLGCGDLFLPTSPPVSGSSFCLYTERTFPPSAPMASPLADMMCIPHKGPVPTEHRSHELLPTSPNLPNDGRGDSKISQMLLLQAPLLSGQRSYKQQ